MKTYIKMFDISSEEGLKDWLRKFIKYVRSFKNV
jgi:hypothetical protein